MGYIKNNFLNYKSYYGTVHFDSEKFILYGEVLGVNKLLTYHATNLDGLQKEFQNQIDEYLKECQEKNIRPNTLFKGQLNIKVKPEMHRELYYYSKSVGKSITKSVSDAIEEYLIKH